MRRSLRNLSIAAVLTVVGAITISPGTAEAFCCPSITRLRLSLPSPTTVPKLLGIVEVNECEGMSFLHIILRGKVADGTQFIPSFPGPAPLLGDWITINNASGDYIWQGVTTFGAPSGGLAGRTLTIMDSNFTPVLQGTF